VYFAQFKDEIPSQSEEQRASSVETLLIIYEKTASTSGSVV